MDFRQNFVDLTDDERGRLAGALNELHDSDIDTGFTDEHDASFFNGIHFGPAFLPWHRHFLLRFEQELQNTPTGLAASAAGIRIMLPFWDWTRSDSRSLEIEPWKSFFGGRANSGGNFDDWNYMRNEPEPDPNGRLPDLRPVGSGASVIVNELQATTYATFRAMECGSHVPGHTWTGGTMASSRSPADPLFYLHHCNVDRLWAIWQFNHPEDPQYSTDNSGNPCADGVSSAFVALNASMVGGATPASMLDHNALGYRYPRDIELEAAWSAEGLGSLVTGDPSESHVWLEPVLNTMMR